MFFKIIWTLVLIKTNAILNAQQSLLCPSSNIYFEKIIGLPSTRVNNQQLLFKSNSTNPITLDCIEACKTKENCHSFILFFNKLECYWFNTDIAKNRINSQFEEADQNAVIFAKLCLESNKNLKNCKNSWIFEKVRGAILIGNDTKTLSTNLSSLECLEACLAENNFQCKSTKFIDNFNQKHNESIGTCILSGTDRHLMPTSFRVSTFDEYYLENQCTDHKDNNSSNKDTKDNGYCTYEEYENVSFGHQDLLFKNTTKEECEKNCNTLEKFNCRAFTISNKKNCILHSEDTKLLGPRILIADNSSTYYEKARCLNISVTCSDSLMTIQYKPEVNFRGKLYMEGNSETSGCFVVGKGNFSLITLKVPILTNKCGIINANSPANRSLLSGTLILQYNEFVQTQSDRILKVGCIFGNHSKVVLGTGVSISSNLPNKGSTLINSTSNNTKAPSVEMKIIDFRTQEETADVQIGQQLQLIIELKDTTNTLDFWAAHLVAMTEKGDESILLLNDRGCPTNFNIFPSLTKISTNDTKKLFATFEAFKFASSQIVRFSVIIEFCANECLPIKCDNNIESYGRRKRESTVINQMPLEYVMVVHNSDADSNADDYLLLGKEKDAKVIVAGYNYRTNKVCMDYTLVIGLIVTWIMVQVIFIIVAVYLIQRYKRQYEEAYARASIDDINKNFGFGFNNMENRRVRWADDPDNFM